MLVALNTRPEARVLRLDLPAGFTATADAFQEAVVTLDGGRFNLPVPAGATASYLRR